MQIWLPIIINLLMLGIVLGCVFNAKSNGWKIELSKLILSLGALVGIYFLSPIITNALIHILIPNENQFNDLLINTPYIISAINSLIIFILFMISYLLISIIIKTINNRIIKNKYNLNYIRVKKNRKLNRQNKREYKRQIKQMYKVSINSQIFAIIFGFISALVITFLLCMPVNYLFKQYTNVEAPALEYTLWGEVDKATDVYDIINNKTLNYIEGKK